MAQSNEVETITVQIHQLPEAAGLPLPRYMTDHSAGMDLYAAVEGEVVLAPGERRLISTGVRISLPAGYEAQIRPRSGLALKHGVTLLNSPGTIDADYRGTVCVIAINLGGDPFVIRRGDRIAQMVLAPVCRAQVEAVAELAPTDRGRGGFGHTGVGAEKGEALPFGSLRANAQDKQTTEPKSQKGSPCSER